MKTQGLQRDVVFLSGVRTGFGGFGGTLKDLSATDLGAVAARQAIERAGVPADQFSHAVFGNAHQTSADAIYLARHVGLKAGLPIEVPAVTVNRLCGSGFESITQGAQHIILGETKAVLAGGTESMSQAPHVVRGARWGIRLGPGSRRSRTCCGKPYETRSAASRWPKPPKVSRSSTSSPATRWTRWRSAQQLAKEAWDACVFEDEVVPVPVKGKQDPRRVLVRTSTCGPPRPWTPCSVSNPISRPAGS